MKRFCVLMITLMAVVTMTCLSLVACDDTQNPNYNNSPPPPAIDIIDGVTRYAIDAQRDESGSLIHQGYTVYEPNEEEFGKPQYGVIFYLGTNMKASYYDYLGMALAKSGYATLIYHATNPFFNFMPTEHAFSLFPDVKFFVSGHSQGGAAAIRRSAQLKDEILGTILLDAVGLRRDFWGEDGSYRKDYDSLADTMIPILFLKTTDELVVKESQREFALTLMNDTTIVYTLSTGTHFSFANIDNYTSAREEIVSEVLSFIESVISK